jgi:membrane associated rhomboid family serine protease
MGLAEREYQRRMPRSPSRLTPVVRGLLWVQCGLFVLDYLVLPAVLGWKVDAMNKPPLVTLGAFTVHSALKEWHLWEFITFQFLHDSVGHVLFNSIGLYFFGPWAERWWGAKRFLIYYLLCGCAGAGFFTLLMTLGIVPGSEDSWLIGASAGIYGIFVAVAVLAPNMRVMLLIPPVELSMRQLAIGLIVISVGIIVIGIGNNEGGEAGHMGGFIAGFVLMKFPWLLGGGLRPPVFHFRPKHESKLRPRARIGGLSVDPEVDRILDKISQEGFQSLTPEEREVLDRAAQAKDHES